MLEIITILLTINLIFVIVTDVSDFPDNAKKALTFILTRGLMSRNDYRFHILDCSFCQIFWFSLIALLLIKGLTFMNLIYFTALSLLSAFSSGLVRDMLYFLQDLLRLPIILFNKYINKHK